MGYGSMCKFKFGIYNSPRLAVLAVLLALFLTGCQFPGNDSPTWYGYVVGDDRRIYMVNLATGQLEWISRVLVEAGAFNEGVIDISDVEIYAEESILYVSSEDYIGRRDYVPLFAVRLNATADPVFQLTMDHPSGAIRNAYSVNFNSGADELYASFYGAEPRNLILNPVTAEVIGGTNTIIREPAQFSPDGANILRFLPGNSRREDGEVVEHPAELVIRDIKTGKLVSRLDMESNHGQYQLWGVPGDYILRYRWPYSNSTIEVYDKINGKLLNSYGIIETFGAYPTQFYATHIPATGNVAMSMGGSIVVFDPLTAEVRQRIYIGGHLSEVVVTDKPLIRTGN